MGGEERRASSGPLPLLFAREGSEAEGARGERERGASRKGRSPLAPARRRRPAAVHPLPPRWASTQKNPPRLAFGSVLGARGSQRLAALRVLASQPCPRLTARRRRGRLPPADPRRSRGKREPREATRARAGEGVAGEREKAAPLRVEAEGPELAGERGAGGAVGP